MEDRLIKELMASIECGSCGQHYEVYNIDVLGHSKGLWFLRARCSSCQAQSLMAAIIKEDKMPEVVTDLTEAELDKFIDMGVVGADDVLDMHNFLKDFDSNFSHLFGQE